MADFDDDVIVISSSDDENSTAEIFNQAAVNHDVPKEPDKPPSNAAETFQQFVEMCAGYLRSSKEGAKILKHLNDLHKRADVDFLNSKTFFKHITHAKDELITKKQSVMFINLKETCDILKTNLSKESILWSTEKQTATTRPLISSKQQSPCVMKMTNGYIPDEAKSNDIKNVEQALVAQQTIGTQWSNNKPHSAEITPDSNNDSRFRYNSEFYVDDDITVSTVDEKVPKVEMVVRVTRCSKTSTGSADEKETVAELSNLEKAADENSEAEKQKKKEKKRQSQIRRLEILLKKLSKKIKQYQEKDLSLDDMARSDSTHMQENLFKGRFMKVWNKLCELTGSMTSTGRVIEQNVAFAGTRYPEINRKIERFVNRHDFPDFHDIVNVVKKANKKSSLGLPNNKVVHIAREAFVEVGQKLQNRRIQDFSYNFGSHLTDDSQDFVDPAKSDKELAEKLQTNWSKRRKVEDVVNFYANKEEEPDDCSEEDEDDESEENDKMVSETGQLLDVGDADEMGSDFETTEIDDTLMEKEDKQRGGEEAVNADLGMDRIDACGTVSEPTSASTSPDRPFEGGNEFDDQIVDLNTDIVAPIQTSDIVILSDEYDEIGHITPSDYDPGDNSSSTTNNKRPISDSDTSEDRQRLSNRRRITPVRLQVKLTKLPLIGVEKKSLSDV